MGFEDEQLMQAQAGQAERAVVKGAEGAVQEGNENDEAVAEAREVAVNAERVALEKKQRNDEYAASLEMVNAQMKEVNDKIRTVDEKMKKAYINVLASLQGQKDELLKAFDKAVDQGTESKQ